MKITVNENCTIDETFCGLASDRDGDVWLFTTTDAIFLHEDESKVYTKEESLTHGPFTKFFGTVTLEND